MEPKNQTAPYRKRHRRLLRYGARALLAPAILCLAPAVIPVAEASDDFLSISFSEKKQVRSSMRWMHGLPKLMMVGQESDTPVSTATLASGVSPVTKEAYYSDHTGDKHMPYAVIGKLFYVKPDNTVATCNGALTGSSDVILTAAHCVLDVGGEWHRYFLFIQGYATTQPRVYAISCAAVPGAWGSLAGWESYPYDYAFMKLRRPSSDGSLGMSSGIPPRHLQLIGYADNLAEGQLLVEVEATLDKFDGNLIRASNNPLKSGSSGMPWIAASIVHSVSSFWLPGEERSMWGPRFTQSTFSLLRHVQNGCSS
ncbi:MAG: hypothetical protein AAGI24_17455 [Pseudomonadota bacterium]